MSIYKAMRHSAAMHILFSSELKSPFDKYILRICQLTAALSFGGIGVLQGFYDNYPWTNDAINFLILLSLFLFIFSFWYLGIRTVGIRAGKRSFISQASFSMQRLFVYLLLPCALLTALTIIWAIITKQPAFR